MHHCHLLVHFIGPSDGDLSTKRSVWYSNMDTGSAHHFKAILNPPQHLLPSQYLEFS